MKKKVKKGQGFVGMSFSTLFSIIIIIFLVFIAGIVIWNFMSTRDCAMLELFVNDFRAKINTVWDSNKDDTPFATNLPNKIKFVCFANLSKSISANGIERTIGDELKLYYEGSKDNMFFYPKSAVCQVPSTDIPHLNMEKILATKNPYCLPIKSGRIVINVEKDFGESLVTIS